MISKLPTVIPVSDLEQKREILAALALGEQEIAEGIGYDLDEILAEADRLLEGISKAGPVRLGVLTP